MAVGPGWGRPRARRWSDLSARTQGTWRSRGRPYGLTGQQAFRWARLSPREQERYAGFGRRHGLSWAEVYREPLLVTAARRHPSPLSAPWAYHWRTLWRRREELARVARTDVGQFIARSQRPPEVSGTDLTLGRFWLYVSPDEFPDTAPDGPWHSSLTVRAPETGPGGYGDMENAFVRPSGIDWVVLSYAPAPSAYVWVIWFPETSPGGGERHA